ncbi:hypothetical protein D3C72_1914820 [compost metagenome]
MRALRQRPGHSAIPLLDPALQQTANTESPRTSGHKTDVRVQRQPIGQDDPPATPIAHHLAIQLGHDAVLQRIASSEGGVIARHALGCAQNLYSIRSRTLASHFGHGREVRRAAKRPQHQP